jgi:glycosyltransferase involved in cell wall biosynthesis
MNAVIIIPTYNEKGNIERLIDVLEKEVFPQIKNYKMGILVADDSSPDGTGEIVKDLMKKWDNIKLSEGKKEGLGAAYIRGMNLAISEMNAIQKRCLGVRRAPENSLPTSPATFHRSSALLVSQWPVAQTQSNQNSFPREEGTPPPTRTHRAQRSEPRTW